METNKIKTTDIFDFIIREIENSSGKKIETKNIGDGYFFI